MANPSQSVNNTLRLVLKTNSNSLTAALKQQGGPSAWYYRKLSSIFGMFSNGAYSANVTVTPTVVAASGTITLSAMVATDTIIVNGVTFTCVASGATGNQFNVGGSDTLTAASFVTAFNAATSTSIKNCVVASSVAAVITLTSAVPGNIGNCITQTCAAHGTVSAARLAGGTEGVTATFAHGL
jgi:flagellar hook-associated protein 3 FlgL